MDHYERFRDDLYCALSRLHDPDYQAPAALIDIVAGGSTAGTSSVQYAIIEAIRQLAPPADTPGSASIQSHYKLLVHRFIENLTQAETAEQLNTTERNIRRMQRVATHMLARFLWEHRAHPVAELTKAMSPQPESSDLEQLSSDTWRSQARQELDSLRQSDPATTADVDSIVRRVMALEQALAESYGVTMTLGEIARNLTAAVNPTALRQILIMTIGWLNRTNKPREIRIDAWEEDGLAVTRLRGVDCRNRVAGDDALTNEMLRLLGGSMTSTAEEGDVAVIIRVPAAGQVNVVVIDDNQDFVHFCRRCVRGTRFRVEDLEDWSVTAIREADPDVILLDIMLPGLDGWELLNELRRDPDTAGIPVVICSIVREEALASLMGAVEYLPKPVDHRDLLNILERVTS